MSSIPKSKSNRELAPEGTHNAVCCGFIDLGTQTVTFQGNEKQQRQCQMTFELLDERTSDDKAMVIYKKMSFTASSKGNLMKLLNGWIGKSKVTPDFDMDNLLGKHASVTIEHNEVEAGTFANVTNVAALPKGVRLKKGSEPFRSLYLDDSFDPEVFDTLPDFLKEKIMVTKEYIEYGEALVKKFNAKKGKGGKGK